MGMYCFGIDVGGTSVKCGLFLTNGTLVEQWEIPTRLENNGSSILPDVADAIKTKLDERGITKDNVDGVGIGIQDLLMRMVKFLWQVICTGALRP